MQFQDYYQTLGVPKDASTEDVKKAYRKLAMKWHPDRASGDKKQAEENFKEVSEAYEVLSDPEKRGKYDTLGPDWEAGPQAAPGGPGTRTMSPEEFEEMFGGRGFSDFFTTLFGDDMARQQGRGRQHPRFRHRGADARAALSVPLRLALKGGVQAFDITTQSACGTCGGTGMMEPPHVCPACGGLGQVRGRRRVDLTIPAGLANGQTLRLRDMGEPGLEGGEAGDLLITLTWAEDSVYKADGENVTAEVPLLPWEAALGTTVTVGTLDKEVSLKIPPGTQTGTRLRIRGEGLPRGGALRGDFFVQVKIVLPDALTAEQKELLRKIADSGPTSLSGGARRGAGAS